MALGTGDGGYRLAPEFCLIGREDLGHETRQHDTDSSRHADTRTGACGATGSPQSFRHLVFHELVEVTYRLNAGALVDHLPYFIRRSDRGDEEIDEGQAVLFEFDSNDVFEVFGQFSILGRQFEKGIERLAKQVVHPGDDDVAEVVLYVRRRVLRLTADDGIQEQHRLSDAHGEGSVATETNQAEFTVLESDRQFGPPFEFGKCLEVNEVDLGPKGRGEAKGERKQASEYWDVQGRKGMASSGEGIAGVAVLEEDRHLTVADDELCAEFEIG